jgi:CRISPR/Cas system Type II protein with McrA/HNH and RuvC-like nuclease domain
MSEYGKIHTDGSRSGGQPSDDSIEAKALALINEERAKTNNIPLSWVQVHYGATAKALCRAI